VDGFYPEAEGTALLNACAGAGLDSALNAAQDGRALEKYLSSRLAEIALPDCEGREIRLGSLWAGQAAVLVFLRHYG
jgi:hypothetical protein